MVQPTVAKTIRWRRRKVPKVRITWVGQVGVFLSLLAGYIMQSIPMNIGERVLLSIGLVVLPVVALLLWRAGLLPPERYEEELPPSP